LIGRFLEATWLLWWLLATVIVGRWAWRLFADKPVRPYEPPAHWRNLYRQALLEHDETKLGIRIQEAERAILRALATQVFASDSTEKTMLQEAMDSLHSLRQTHSNGSDKSQVSA